MIELEKWMDEYFYEQEIARIEENSNPGIRRALEEPKTVEEYVDAIYKED